jgi:prohibitin 1
MTKKLSSNGLLMAGAAIGVFGLILVSNAITVLQPGEVGIRQTLGRLHEDEVAREGVHVKWPFISKFTTYNEKIQQSKYEIAAATKDLQEVNGQLTVFYKIDSASLVFLRRSIGDMADVEQKVGSIAQETFKATSAKFPAEETVTRRNDLRKEFDTEIASRLKKFGIVYQDAAIENLKFSAEFEKSVEEKQIAEQEAKKAVFVAQRAEQEAAAEVNRAKGKAESQRLLAGTLKAAGGELVLQKEAIEAWKSGGAQMPQVLVVGEGGQLPFILNGLSPEVKPKAK